MHERGHRTACETNERTGFVCALERTLLVSALALAALLFFRPTRVLGRVLFVLWLVAAWPLAWLGERLSVRRPAAARRSLS